MARQSLESGFKYVLMKYLYTLIQSMVVGAFIVQFLELLNQIPEEIDYLWRTPFRLVTGLYAWSRYFPLCVQIVNITLSELIHANPRPKLCHFTFIVKAISGQLVTTCVETILMIRVHALYNNSRPTGLLLLTIMISGTSLELMGSVFSVSDIKPGPTRTICSPKQSPAKAVITYLIGAGLIQGTLLIMTVGRVLRYRQTGWMKKPVISLLLRDSVFVFLSLTIILVALVIADSEMVHNEDRLLWNIAFSWYMALLSIVGCRLVLNMRTLAVRDTRNQQTISDSIQLSSLFENQFISAPEDNTT